MIKEHSIFDYDPKGENGGTGHRLDIQFDFRLVEMLQDEEKVLERMRTELQGVFKRTREAMVKGS
jgi:hypothetical protein